MLKRHVSSTYWTFMIIAVLTAGVLSFTFGYTYRANHEFSNFSPTNTNQPNITGDILEQQIQANLMPKTVQDAVTGPSELHVYTGYIRAISDTSITVDHPDATTTFSDQLAFTLTDQTKYADLATTIDSNGLPGSIETGLVHDDLLVGEIVTVYCNEDIRTSAVRVVTKVQRLKAQ